MTGERAWAHDAHCNTNHEAGPQACPPAREDTDRLLPSGVTADAAVLRLRPGDKLLVRVANTVTSEQAQRLLAALKEFLPTTTIQMVGGVEQILVVEGDAA